MEPRYSVFESHARQISQLPAGNLSKAQLQQPAFEIHRWGNLAMYYAPFDHVNTSAKVAVVGITPGWTQMEIAFRVARQGLHDSENSEDILRNAKVAASFAGQMRANLLAMLDDIGVPSALGIKSSADLFGDRSELQHSTSAIRYPVFRRGENYTGHGPKPLDDTHLRDFMLRNLGPELQATSKAFIIPLGKVVDETIQFLIARGMLEPERCAGGFPHPSPANGHRRSIFEKNEAALKQAVGRWFS
jgi:hypothetical protein